MKKSRFSEQTYYGGKAKYGGMQVDELRAVRTLAEKNARLKSIVADLSVQIDILKAVNAKYGKPVQKTQNGAIPWRRSWEDRPSVCALKLARSGKLRIFVFYLRARGLK